MGFGAIGRIVVCCGGKTTGRPAGGANIIATGGFVGAIVGLRVGCRVSRRVGLEVGFGVSSSSVFMSKISLMIKKKFERRLSSIRTSSSEHPYS